MKNRILWVLTGACLLLGPWTFVQLYALIGAVPMRLLVICMSVPALILAIKLIGKGARE